MAITKPFIRLCSFVCSFFFSTPFRSVGWLTVIVITFSSRFYLSVWILCIAFINMVDLLIYSKRLLLFEYDIHSSSNNNNNIGNNNTVASFKAHQTIQLLNSVSFSSSSLLWVYLFVVVVAKAWKSEISHPKGHPTKQNRTELSIHSSAKKLLLFFISTFHGGIQCD